MNDAATIEALLQRVHSLEAQVAAERTARKALEEAAEDALSCACHCDECDDPGEHYFRTEGDGSFWLCAQIEEGDDAHGDHAMPERYEGAEVEAPDRPLDLLRAALAASRMLP